MINVLRYSRKGLPSRGMAAGYYKRNPRFEGTLGLLAGNDSNSCAV